MLRSKRVLAQNLSVFYGVSRGNTNALGCHAQKKHYLRTDNLTPVSLSALMRCFSSNISPVSNCRVLCVDLVQPLAETTCVQELVQRGHIVDQLKSETKPDLGDIIEKYDALVVSPDTVIPREILKKGADAKLQLIAVPADNIESANIDMMEATNQGIMLLQLEKKQIGDKFSVEAEIAFSLLIQLARNIPQSIQTIKKGLEYQREEFNGVELCDKNLGIIGLGKTGKCVVEMAMAMGLKVYGYDPMLTHEAAASMGIKKASIIDEIYENCDFLAFLAPLTERTRGMFNEASLEKCKPGVRIVSVAEYKGCNGLLDEKILLKGLDNGKIGGLALDMLQDSVVENKSTIIELSEEWKQVLNHPNVLASSHVDTQKKNSSKNNFFSAKQYRTLAENVGDALARRYYRGIANGVFMPLTLLPEMKPFLILSEAIGRFLYQLSTQTNPKDPISKVLIATSGGLAVDLTKPKAKSALQSAVMKGMLEKNFIKPPQKLNLLNSSMIAMTKGIDVRHGELVNTNDTLHFNNSITVEIETKEKQKFVLTGSVFGEDPRIVRINEYTDFPAFRPEGNLLIFQNEDRPGAIADILQELVQANVNIANFGLSRQINVKYALGILSLDSPLSNDTIQHLKELPTVQSLRFALL